MTKRLRPLRDDEIALWLGVAASITRRAGSTLPMGLAEPEPGTLAAPERVPPPPPRPTKVGPTLPLAPLERTLRRKLTRGRIEADAAIDLHGFRQAEAHAALRRFLARAHADGARVVLVVTGKGGRGDVGRIHGDRLNGGRIEDGQGENREVGVLKRSVPLWLAMPELRPLVVGFEEAGRSHGGAGALYVRLRRRERSS